MKKIKAKMMECGIILIQACILALVTVFSVVPMSCKVTTEGIEIIGADYTAPVLESICVVNDKTIELEFSECIKLNTYVISPVIENVSDSSEISCEQELAKAIRAATDGNNRIESNVVMSSTGKKITFIMEEKTKIGKKYEVYGTVEDRIGNTLTFCIPFTGYNSAVPDMMMTEVQIKYSKGSSAGNTIYRNEFVELLALSKGNLSGLEIVSGMDGEAKKYVLPAVDVEKGEIVVVHLRTAGDGCVNEINEDKNAATAYFSSENTRDLWSENTTTRLHDYSDVVILRNSVSGKVMDGIMYIADADTEWKDGPGELAALLEKDGIYDSSDISGAVSSKGVSPTKSFNRVGVAEVYKKVRAGGRVLLPLKNDSESWQIAPVTPGRIQ